MFNRGRTFSFRPMIVFAMIIFLLSGTSACKSDSETSSNESDTGSTDEECSENYGKIIYSDNDPSVDPVIDEIIIADENGNKIDSISIEETMIGLGDPAWSPNHCRIAFSGGDKRIHDGNIDIYTMDPDGTNIVRLTDSPKAEMDLDWSPDGKQIVYVLHSNDGPGGIPVRHIYIMNADGSDQHLLSDVDDFLTDPEWSPTGDQIVFECKNPGRPATGTGGAICVIDADGENFKMLNPSDNIVVHHPTWSPDGTQIAVSYGASDIGIMNADGSDFHSLHINGVYFAQDIKWSPDGKYIITEDIGSPNENRYYDLLIIDLDTLGVKMITEGRNGTEGSPDW